MAKTYLSNVDLAWLRMDDPNNRMIITAFMTLESPITAEKLKKIIAGSLLKFERFRQRLVVPDLPLQRPYWQEEENLSLDDHIETVRLLPPCGEEELQDFISALMSVPLDPKKPLWKVYLVEHYQQGSALIGRLHHAIADGIALMYVLLSMASEDPNAPLPEPFSPPADGTGGESESGGVLSAGIDRAMELTADLTGKVGDEIIRILADSDYARQQAKLGAKAAMAFARLVLRLPDPPTLFKGNPSFSKRAAWSAPLSLEHVKQTGKALDSTINDILLASVAGALGRYVRRRGHSADGLNIRGLIPVNLRPLDLAGELGNRFGLVFLGLPLGIDDPIARLRELKRRMDELKSTPEAAVALGVLGLFGAVPERLQDIAVQIFDLKGTAVMTNVPGPRHQLYLGGAPIGTVMAWVPQSGRVSLGVSIISYNGKVWLGVATDQGLVPDPETIVSLFKEEYEDLARLAASQGSPPLRTTADMLAALDAALATVEQVLGGKNNLTTATETVRCQGVTAQGKACKNRPLPGKRYCRFHTS